MFQTKVFQTFGTRRENFGSFERKLKQIDSIVKRTMKQTLSWNGLGLELEGPGPYAGLAHSRSKMLLGTILALI